LVLVVSSIFFSCKKNRPKISYKAKFTTSLNKSLHSEKSDSLHTGFGDYITSVTPYHFSCKMSMLMFQDIYTQADPSCHMISYVDGHDNDPNYEIASYADFSANQEVEFTPILYSTDIRDGLFEQKEIDFKFLTFSPIYFDHGFELPYSYLSLITSSNNNFMPNEAVFTIDTVAQRITVSTKKNFSYGAIHGNANAMPTGFSLVLGNTDSSYIYMYDGTNLDENARFPFWDIGNGVIIRSNNYTPLKVIMPERKEDFTMYSTIAFNTDNLIQIYAGNDNIPYTSDDVFVYAPRFWDRIQVLLETLIN
jgi:hypothetical protein